MKISDVDEILQIRINSILNRLKGVVSVFDILTWLSNFKPDEYQKAITILSKVDYYTEKEIIELLDERLKKLYTFISPETYVIVNPIGEYGKSGTLLIYYFKKTPTYLANANKIRFYETYHVFKKKKRENDIPSNSVVVLLDDFFGSGKSFIDYYSTYIGPQLKSKPEIVAVYIITMFYLGRAKVRIDIKYDNKIKLIGSEINACFNQKRSVFGYREKMLPLRELSYSYAIENDLFSLEDPVTKIVKKHPLGYVNSQALIVFPYNPPNNTLPILWSAKNGWKPLFPRTPHAKISASKKIRSKLAYELGMGFMDRDFIMAGIFKSETRDIGWKTFSFVTKTDFAVFAIMKMVRQKTPVPIICQILGITSTDYDNYILEGQNRNIFNNTGQLSDYGEEIYLDKIKTLKYVRKEFNTPALDFEVKSIKYVPKKFRGRS